MRRTYVISLSIVAISGWVIAIASGLYISGEGGRARARIEDAIGQRNVAALSLCDQMDKLIDYSNKLKGEISTQNNIEVRLIPVIGSQNVSNNSAAQISDAISAFSELRSAGNNVGKLDVESERIKIGVINPARDRCARLRGIILDD